MTVFEAELKKASEQNQLILSPDVFSQLTHYLTLMQTWNRVFNLTTITDPREMVYLHLIDSLLVQPYLRGSRFLDVGSGAGLPGIPLAIMHPEQTWFLLDKNNKKTRFLTQCVAELGLKNVTVIHSRTDEFKPAEGFDCILSRAFGTLRLFAETTKHLLRPGGILVAMKGKYPEDELSELPSEFKVSLTTPLTMRGLTVDRHLICLEQKAL